MATALLAEIKRLTTILVPGENGFAVTPVSAALSSGAIDKEDWSEVESALVFFTCHYVMAKKRDREKMASATASLLMGSMTPLSATDYADYSATLTKEEDIVQE